MPSGQCWSTAQSSNNMHRTILKDMFPCGIERIFIDLADIPKPTGIVDVNYVTNVMENMFDGLRYWENDEGDNHIYNGTLGEGSTKSHLTMCKALNAIPILCLGHTEERTSWLSRNPIQHIEFLEQFTKYLAGYLRNNLGFIQAHLEVFNEPQKCIPVNDYIKICKAMIKGFTQYPNFKVHIGSNDIDWDLYLPGHEYLPNIIKDKELMSMMKGHYYSTHVLWERQHNQGYIKEVNEILFGTGVKQSVTEFSPDGDWGTLGELLQNKIEIYCILFVLRNDFFADVFDDIYIFDKHKGPEIISYNEKKHIILKDFNNRFYNKPLPIEDEDMKLEKIYFKDKTVYNVDPKHAGVKFIQTVLGLVPDGNFGIKTDSAVKAYQISKGLVADGKVGATTFTAMIDEFPRLWDELQYNVAIGAW